MRCNPPVPHDLQVTDTRQQSGAEPTERLGAGPLPPPPRPVPAGVEWIARAIGRRVEGAAARSIAPPRIPGYEILGELGRGGMGVVYHARHLQLNREVALKMVLHGPHAAPRELDRLRSEAEAIARLQHPHIVQIFEVGEIEGSPFCALEYVDGGSLADLVRGTPQPYRQAVEYVMKVCEAVAYAHERGILHRDLKPSNVLLTREGVPKVTDFGLAKQYEATEGPTVDAGAPADRSQSQVVGTPSYMAPELLRLSSRPMQATVDVYGLGAILYELLTGRPPFQAESPQETLVQALLNDPVPPAKLQPKLPRDLDTICLKCLAKTPTRRYLTAESLHGDLCRFVAGRPISARPTSVWERAAKWARRRPALATLAALATAMVAGLLLVGWGIAARERYQAGLLKEERNRALQERNEKTLFLEKSLAASQQLKELADAMATLPEGQLRRQLQEERLRIYLEVVQQSSEDALISREQARTFQRLADIYRSLKQPEEALRAQRSANQIFLRLVQSDPHSTEYEGDYVVGLDRLGLLLKQNQQFTDAQQVLRDGIARAEQLVVRSPATPRFHSTLGTMLNNLATSVYESDDPQQLAEARTMLERAIEHQQQAVAKDAPPLYTMFLRNHHGALTEVLLRQGDYTRAAGIALLLPTFFPEEPLDYKRAADFLDRCSGSARDDASVDPSLREQHAAHYAEEATRLMDEARRHGYRVPRGRTDT
jgi:tetratricopeptide (TPR) repeat protein/predicted Ser/Thr protein kinase